jgi:hypothetical protein
MFQSTSGSNKKTSNFENLLVGGAVVGSQYGCERGRHGSDKQAVGIKRGSYKIVADLSRGLSNGWRYDFCSADSLLRLCSAKPAARYVNGEYGEYEGNYESSAICTTASEAGWSRCHTYSSMRSRLFFSPSRESGFDMVAQALVVKGLAAVFLAVEFTASIFNFQVKFKQPEVW